MRPVPVTMIIAGLFVAGAAFAEFPVSSWKYEKPINMPGFIPPGSYAKVALDKETLFGAQRDLRDLRLVTNEGVEVPYQLIVENESVRNEYVPTTLRDISQQGGKTMFIIDLGITGVLHDHIVIGTQSTNFKRSVAVSVSDNALSVDDPAWRTLATDGYIYNFFDPVSGFNAGKTDVFYPVSTARYVRVEIGDGEGGAVAVSGANIYRLVASRAQELSLDADATVVENPKHRTTEIALDLGGRGLQTHRVTLRTFADKNFSRRAVVESSEDGTHWSAIGRGYVFRLRTPKFWGDQLTLSFPETLSRYLRVIVSNDDDAPVAWETKVTVESAIRSLVFLPEVAKKHLLYYGDPSAQAPQYDIGRYLQYYDSVELPNATLGHQTVNPAYVLPKAGTPADPNRGVKMLDSILGLLVAVIGTFTILYLKKLKLTRHIP